MSATTTANFVNAYAAARKASADADKALATALLHLTPPSADLHALMLTRPEGYAECLRKMADIAASLPMLREDVQRANTIADELSERACFHCHGTGNYQAPTSYLTRGKPQCWNCGGSGEARKK